MSSVDGPKESISDQFMKGLELQSDHPFESLDKIQSGGCSSAKLLLEAKRKQRELEQNRITGTSSSKPTNVKPIERAETIFDQISKSHIEIPDNWKRNSKESHKSKAINEQNISKSKQLKKKSGIDYADKLKAKSHSKINRKQRILKMKNS
eukprot:CAMPEP_0182419374 /NCGR_PEP_ID=MMETSP1167-20130531/3839_1 /TAXON_ID=2988 /ORGANISM="Mallomonas Sp, Strain CCMP3275" /LENGTH=150 /DNA_ID=CAMNT_0024594263 /DNA_START=57 /DNA_END=506 /DNA_ORIENTATION=-